MAITNKDRISRAIDAFTGWLCLLTSTRELKSAWRRQLGSASRSVPRPAFCPATRTGVLDAQASAHNHAPELERCVQ